MNDKQEKDVRDQIGLKFVEVDIERTIETERGCDGGNNLGYQSVEVGEARRTDGQILFANVVNRFVINLF